MPTDTQLGDLKSGNSIFRKSCSGFTSSTIRLSIRLYGEMEKTLKPLETSRSSTYPTSGATHDTTSLHSLARSCSSDETRMPSSSGGKFIAVQSWEP